MSPSEDSAVSSPFVQSPKLGAMNGTPKPNGAVVNGQRNDFLSDRAASTEIDGIRGLMPLEGPGIITFLAGRPNPTTFPFDSITLHMKPPLGGGEKRDVELDGELLDAAMQYGPSAGLPQIRKWLSDLQTHVHGRAPGNWAVSMGSGSQDLMSKAFHAVLNPGDPILMETPVYSGVLPTLRLLQAKMVEVDVDDEGLSATRLEEILANWPADQKRPRVIYSTPVGCNPSGCSASKQRKLDVLAVMKKYDLLMMEDYLTQNLIPSYFELETQVFPEGGHVLRFDSFSKLLSAGIRLGFATGPKDILHGIDVNTAGANLHTSALSQAVAFKLLEAWGIEGFLSHAHCVADFYAERRDIFEAAARKHLDGLAKWVSPVAGMFLWIDMSPAGITDSYKLIRNEAFAKGVLAVPGQAFYPSGRPSPHVRVSFSVIDLETEAPEGFRRLAEAIHDKRRELGLE
ncbi:putative aromatic amino acid transaminase [Cutaneotrichosporon oleaginosum]|uniref:Putative aromatic amino acid transaminase n=1 Tax=Cutaneotrichosporon oleaginosum TaxID=879819 RepID=A0A0J0XZQ3_9TREE|nr:putative aromatic amino acid transaminase [Cutaneotrichosporon oleaginosum]KLT46525.1 putative aromatic amino acid transaminase [Cutaneotrichosporon oleaginosum]